MTSPASGSSGVPPVAFGVPPISSDPPTVAIVGAGPAGLRAAEVISAAGIRVTLFDKMRSAGRKFLVAGRGGLNLTHSEPLDTFITRYSDGSTPPPISSSRWASLLGDFSPEHLRHWAADLGIESYIGSSGRVFPKGNQSATLLRTWTRLLRASGVEFRFQHHLVGLETGPTPRLHMVGPAGENTLSPSAVVFALGGASWPQTGSTGDWLAPFREAGINLSPLVPANCGFNVAWPPRVLEQAEGLPLKNLAASAGGAHVRGEALLTQAGIEGGAIYQLSRQLRDGNPLHLDLKPDQEESALARRLTAVNTFSQVDKVKTAWKNSPAARTLLDAYADWSSAESLARTAKHLPIPITGPRPIEEAISSAGGIQWDELDEALMLKRFPGWFAAGEMIDWEAPTGGYLLQGCFATGTRAGRGVVNWLDTQSRSASP